MKEFKIQSYKEAEQTQNKVYELQNTENERHNEKKNEIYFKYSKLESDLNRKKYAEEREAEAEHNKQKEVLKSQRAEADKQQTTFKRIIAFMDILKTEADFKKDDFGAYVYEYPRDKKGEILRVLKGNCYCYPNKEKVYLKPIDTLHENETLNLKVYIGDNDKPKNKKSLFIFGKTLLMTTKHESKVLKLPHDYLITAHDENAPIRYKIKDFPTEKEAKAYYEKNKTKFLKSFISEHKNAVIELEEVRKNTTSKEWELFYLETKRDYYINSYSGYEENEEYQKLLKQITDFEEV
jgi:hypothetical protein